MCDREKLLRFVLDIHMYLCSYPVAGNALIGIRNRCIESKTISILDPLCSNFALTSSCKSNTPRAVSSF